VVEGRLEAVRAVLEAAGLAGQPGAAPTSLPLRRFPEVHFARIFVLEEATLSSGRHVPASLVYMADVDGSVDEHLRALVDRAAAGVDELFGDCEGYPGPGGGDVALLTWLHSHRLTPAAYYVHTVGRTVQQIRDEARLFETLGDIVDSGEVTTSALRPPSCGGACATEYSAGRASTGSSDHLPAPAPCTGCATPSICTRRWPCCSCWRRSRSYRWRCGWCWCGWPS
jgi:hypothetical protein